MAVKDFQQPFQLILDNFVADRVCFSMMHFNPSLAHKAWNERIIRPIFFQLSFLAKDVSVEKKSPNQEDFCQT